MVRERVDERENSGAMLRPSPSSHQDAHQHAVRNIADQLFPFPTPDYPDFRTLYITPPFPGYVSGHAGYSGAAAGTPAPRAGRGCGQARPRSRAPR
jgi:hypothetical protein